MKRISVILIFIGIIVCAYPVVSNQIAQKHQNNVIIGYESLVANSDEERINEEWEKAYTYSEIPEDYMNVLNINNDGVMGYIEIPEINAKIPIYHTATEESLNKGVGHVEQTDLPIGKTGSRPVLTGHRGLPNAELFTRLDEVDINEYFHIYILDKVFYYKVIERTVILPEEIENLKAVENKDLVTLVTCTPYGVNTHRLVITGERIEKLVITEKVEEDDSIKRKQLTVMLLILVGLLILWCPMASHRLYYANVKTQKEKFINNCKDKENKTELLYRELRKQNEELYKKKQVDFANQSAYEKANINLKYYGIDHNTIGFIKIPKMKIELPILLGANEDNMKKGAVHLTETSYPIGGENTNCVIAAHRGYSKTAMFRDIEKLEKGDKIYIQNFKERLIYKVVQVAVINPTEIKKILIRENKDMITLITCHPYRKNYQRYIVFCERVLK